MPIYAYDKGGKEHYYYAFEVKDQNGKRKTIKKRGFKGKTECKKAEAEARVSWEKGSYIDPSKMTFEEYITNWLDNKQDISRETRETNRGHLKNHIVPVIGSVPLQKVNVMHIEKLTKSMKDKKLADGTIKKVFNLVNTAFRSAEKRELISKNPFNLLDKGSKPRDSKAKIDYWTLEEVRKFFSVLEHRQKILFVLAIHTGMRRGEMLGLRWKDINFENRQIRISQSLKPRQGLTEGVKTDAGYRSITISPFVISELKKHRNMIVQEKLAHDEYDDHDLVICQENGKPVSLGNFTKFWNRMIEKTEMRYIRFHDLRHTCASLLLSAGTHPKIVQELLGHSSIKITLDRYSHMMPNLQENAAMTLEKMLK
ncbi:site-specific integrase [Virgibacillus salexigens]|uniref:site-specific integrase n=1 Tax=Virgibacillus salexigens TaxID=61016 RepID=UPI0030819571